MSLRLKLLLLGLLTLVLPWGGCRYARQMEAALREGEPNSLQAVAQTIAASLQGRTDLLYREGRRPARAPPRRADTPDEPHRQGPSRFTSPAPTICSPSLSAPRFWMATATSGRATRHLAVFHQDDQHRFGILTGVYDRML